MPKSNGLRVVLSVRPVASDGQDGGLPQGVRSVSVFLVNRRTPAPDEIRDEAFAFQTQLEVACDTPFVPRPNLRSLESDDWDERVADLQYRDACEFAVGHSVADRDGRRGTGTAAGRCAPAGFPRPRSSGSRPAPITGVELSMEALASLPTARMPRPSWAASSPSTGTGSRSSGRRCRIVADAAQGDRQGTARPGRGRRQPHRARDRAAGRPAVPGGFRIANRAMAAAAKRRLGRHAGQGPGHDQRRRGGRSSSPSS